MMRDEEEEDEEDDGIVEEWGAATTPLGAADADRRPRPELLGLRRLFNPGDVQCPTRSTVGGLTVQRVEQFTDWVPVRLRQRHDFVKMPVKDTQGMWALISVVALEYVP